MFWGFSIINIIYNLDKTTGGVNYDNPNATSCTERNKGK